MSTAGRHVPHVSPADVYALVRLHLFATTTGNVRATDAKIVPAIGGMYVRLRTVRMCLQHGRIAEHHGVDQSGYHLDCY